jgi:hypothetical protein
MGIEVGDGGLEEPGVPRVVVVENGDELAPGGGERGVGRSLHARGLPPVDEPRPVPRRVRERGDHVLDGSALASVIDDDELVIGESLIVDRGHSAFEEDRTIAGPHQDADTG